MARRRTPKEPIALGPRWDALLEILLGMDRLTVAYSGGVDSTLLLAAAQEALGPDRVSAVVADTPLLPTGEAEKAVELASSLGIRVQVMTLDPLEEKEVAGNPPDRCYHCKRLLFSAILARTREAGAVLVEGSHAGDLFERRPGARALSDLGVRSPLAEAGLDKEEIRRLSRALGLPTWDKPSAPCLATRFPYGAAITREGLRRVEEGELLLAAEGFSSFRLRSHGKTARIEVPPGQFLRLLEPHRRKRILNRLKELGWTYVTLDLAGFRSGSMDEALGGDG